jgi:hypothetical protein
VDRLERQAGAAADVQHRVAAVQAKAGDGLATDGFEKRKLGVVAGGAPAVLRQRGGTIGRPASGRKLQRHGVLANG